MTTSAVPEPVRELIQVAVDSYEKLFLLDALFCAEEPLDTAALSERTNAPLYILDDALSALTRAGLVEQSSDGMYVYARGDPARDDAVRALRTLLTTDPIELSRLLDRAAMIRARTALEERLSSGYRLRHLRKHEPL